MSESNFPKSETTNTDFSEQQKRPTEDEIERYRASVAMRIINNNTELIENHGADYARAVIGELILSAEKDIYLFCEKLSEIIYQPLLFHFFLAFVKGVNIHIITQADPQDSETSQFLMQKGCIRKLLSASQHEHFLIIDGIRYRQERDAQKKNAIVCPKVSRDVMTHDHMSTLNVANSLKEYFMQEWGNAQAL